MEGLQHNLNHGRKDFMFLKVVNHFIENNKLICIAIIIVVIACCIVM